MAMLIGTYRRTGNPLVFDQIIEAQRHAVRASGGDPRSHALELQRLGALLNRRHQGSPSADDLSEAVSCLRRAVLAARDDARDDCRNTLAMVLINQAAHTGEPAPLAEAEAALRSALERAGAGDPRRATWLRSLATVFNARYEMRGAAADLREAVATLEEALPLAEAGTWDHADVRASLGAALGTRYRADGDPGDLRRAVGLLREALEETPAELPWRGVRLGNLGVLLQQSYERHGDRRDLAEAAAVIGEALELLPETHYQRGFLESTLSAVLTTEVLAGGDPAEADLAVARARSSVADTGPARMGHASRLSNLGQALLTRHRLTGRRTDLTEGIETLRTAAGLAPAEGPFAAVIANNLGLALLNRFRLAGTAADLEEAVHRLRQATLAVPARHPARPRYLANLGAALAGGPAPGPATIERCVAALAEAVETGSGDVFRPVYTGGLGAAHLMRYLLTGAAADLDAADRLLRESIAALPVTGPERPAMVEHLVRAYLTRSEASGENPSGRFAGVPSERFEESSSAPHEENLSGPREGGLSGASGGDPSGGRDRPPTAETALGELDGIGELDELVALLDESLAGLLTGAPRRPFHLTARADLLAARFRATGKADDAVQAVEAWSSTVSDPLASPVLRLHAATRWGRLATSIGWIDSGMEAYRNALDVLPLTAWQAQDRTDQERHLSQQPLVAAEAAACAIEAGAPRLAVELLEQGRSILWSRAIRTDDELVRLRAEWPELAARLGEIRAALDAEDGAADGPLLPAALGEPDRISVRIRLAEEWEELVAHISALPGFADFLRVPRFDLATVDLPGPIVIVNVSPLRCDALIVEEGAVRPVPLPELTVEDVIGHTLTFVRVLETVRPPDTTDTEPDDTEPDANTGPDSTEPDANTGPDDTGPDLDAAHRAFDDMLGRLWSTVAEPVLVALGATGAPEADRWPHVRWCPVGPLALLPLHAAGPPGRDLRVIDRVVSSYVTTLRSVASAAPPTPPSAVPSAVPSGTVLTAASHPAPSPPEAAGSGSPEALIVSVADAPGLPPLREATAEADEAARSVGMPVTRLDGPEARRDRVRAALATCAWAHFACHAGQDRLRPGRSRLHLHDGPLTVAEIGASRGERRGVLAYLSACETAATDAGLADEAIHLAGAVQAIGFRHVIATLWPAADHVAAELARVVYPALATPRGADADRAAWAVHQATRHIRDVYLGEDLPWLWAPFVHVGP
ncbi:CHAT domain-containing protein [Streptosporangium sp. NPDC051022]|uniref:CHAT domain-containing protein n=1 Tax=Streptosporangium sp. NPDC051022 TaxID=3155752 RepID=UPI003413362C